MAVMMSMCYTIPQLYFYENQVHTKGWKFYIGTVLQLNL